MRLIFCGSQVPPDFYIPDFDEDEQNPDERIDRKRKKPFWFPIDLGPYLSLLIWSLFSEHTQDKHIQRDDEYYEGDNDNDQMDAPWSSKLLLLGKWPFLENENVNLIEVPSCIFVRANPWLLYIC